MKMFNVAFFRSPPPPAELSVHRFALHRPAKESGAAYTKAGSRPFLVSTYIARQRWGRGRCELKCKYAAVFVDINESLVG